MTRINLLPWREELRAERKKQFLMTVLLTAVAAGFLLFIIHTVISSRINHQDNRNQFLQTEISKLDRQIAEIRDLERQRAELIKRTEIIQDLQASRPEVVRLFDEIVRTVPEGINLVSLTRKDRKLEFSGEAESIPRISSFMRGIDESEWLLDPVYKGSVENRGRGIPGRAFSLEAMQYSPSAEAVEKAQKEAEEAAAAAKNKKGGKK